MINYSRRKSALPMGVFCAMLSGCALFGNGSDNSEAEVTNWQRCKFDLRQAAKVAGIDDTDVIENVTVTPECEVRIEFRQITGDSLMKIESRGGMDILEHASGPAPVPEQPVPDS